MYCPVNCRFHLNRQKKPEGKCKHILTFVEFIYISASQSNHADNRSRVSVNAQIQQENEKNTSSGLQFCRQKCLADVRRMSRQDMGNSHNHSVRPWWVEKHLRTHANPWGGCATRVDYEQESDTAVLQKCHFVLLQSLLAMFQWICGWFRCIPVCCRYIASSRGY